MAEVVDSAGRVLYNRNANKLWVNNVPAPGDKAANDAITRLFAGNAGRQLSPNTVTLRSSTPQSPIAPGVRTTATGPSPAEVALQKQIDAANQAAAQAAAAEAKARAQADSAARSSANTDIERLNAQITANQSKKATNSSSLAALKKLVEGGHQGTRDAALAALDASLKTKLDQISQTFDTSLSSFRDSLRDNEAAETDDTFSNLVNRAREKQDVVSQALSQGAGESDVLKSQLQALRNWSANQAEINRAFFDTRASVNSGIVDLNNATKTAMMNEELSTNASRGQRWDEFYEAMGSSYSDMANLDQQNYLLDGEVGAAKKQKGASTGLLAWLDSGKKAADYEAPKLPSLDADKPAPYTSQYASKAAEQAAAVWTDPGLSEETKNWKGAAESAGGLNTAVLAGAQTNASSRKKPEGATLRRW